MTDATPAPLAPNPAPALTPVARVEDAAVAAARNLPQLEANLKVVAPDLVGTVEQPAMTAAHGAYGAMLLPLVGLAVAHFGLGWTSDFQALVVGGVLVAGAAAAHLVSAYLPTTIRKVINL